MAIAREPLLEKLSSRGLRRDYTPAPNSVTKAYLLGVLHDATERRTTYRIASKSLAFCEFLKEGIKSLSSGAWIYKEGKDRNLWIVEFPKSLLKKAKIESNQDRIDYVRGYFDTEGGIAKSPRVRYYLYFAQKDKDDLKEVWDYFNRFGIYCGKIHNPSKKVDPNYWRFFIGARSYNDFAKIIGSSHPEKRCFLKYLDEEIVHAHRKIGKNMNKVSVLEGADGSPPF